MVAIVKIAPTACKHRVSGSISLPAWGSFHLSLTVLFTIGHQVVFSLGGWSLLLPTGFHVSRGTLVQRLKLHCPPTRLSLSLVWLSRPFRLLLHFIIRCPQPRIRRYGLGSFPFARHYLGNRCFFLFLGILRCFNSPGSLRHTYVFSMRYMILIMWVSPFGHLGFKCSLAARPSLSQLITSFIGS